ncbi:ICP22 family protein [Microlunatus parietis]|uniref:Signal transduction histidine kinase n=1 Tax=Microlunatus parietis TaxID=682979 RepID=A0A7Y9I464_9ACTN|nr:hypothetical protein [Microlunatus parietis]NYE69909.1 signal transduction histidine kinase [Microlunatus parietis]
MATNGTLHPYLRLALGLGVGALTLIGMIRLVAGNFEGRLALFAWVVVALTMIPWVAYCAWRGWHGKLTRNRAIAVAALVAAGLIVVWLFVLGPVIALVASLAAFVLIWISDWPGKRVTGEERFVRIEELGEPEYEDEADAEQPEAAEQSWAGTEPEAPSEPETGYEPERTDEPGYGAAPDSEPGAVEHDGTDEPGQVRPDQPSGPDPEPGDPRLGRVADQAAT